MQPGNGNVSKWQELRTSLSCDVSIYRWMYALQSIHLFWSPCDCSLANASNIWCARSFLLQERYIHVCIILQYMYIYIYTHCKTLQPQTENEGTKDHVRNHAMTVEDSWRFNISCLTKSISLSQISHFPHSPQGRWTGGTCWCLWNLGFQEPLGASATVRLLIAEPAISHEITLSTARSWSW